jgi:hypothetical protein
MMLAITLIPIIVIMVTVGVGKTGGNESCDKKTADGTY